MAAGGGGKGRSREGGTRAGREGRHPMCRSVNPASSPCGSAAPVAERTCRSLGPWFSWDSLLSAFPTCQLGHFSARVGFHGPSFPRAAPPWLLPGPSSHVALFGLPQAGLAEATVSTRDPGTRRVGNFFRLRAVKFPLPCG